MRRSLALVLGACAVALVSAPRASGAPPEPAPCVSVRAEVRYGAAAYNHIVILTNACARPYTCIVTTDVNPQPMQAVVPPHAVTEVVTFLGSPARTFVPTVACKPQ